MKRKNRVDWRDLLEGDYTTCAECTKCRFARGKVRCIRTGRVIKNIRQRCNAKSRS